jgi:hypothetical protein
LAYTTAINARMHRKLNFRHLMVTLAR